MKIYTAHVLHDSLPILVPEGWSWTAAIFGPFWLLAKRAWIPGLLLLAVTVVAGRVAPALTGVFALGFAVLAGLLGQDALRWTLARRGYVLAAVLAARDADGALIRLLTARPEIAERFAGRLG